MDFSRGKYFISMEDELPQIIEPIYTTQAFGEAEFAESQESRDFLFIGPFAYPQLTNLTSYETLFHMCRLQSIQFDMDFKKGMSFVLFDEPRTQLLGMMTVGESAERIFAAMENAMFFMKKSFKGDASDFDKLMHAIQQNIDNLH